MKESEVMQQLLQAGKEEARELFESFVTTAAREAILLRVAREEGDALGVLGLGVLGLGVLGLGVLWEFWGRTSLNCCW